DDYCIASPPGVGARITSEIVSIQIKGRPGQAPRGSTAYSPTASQGIEMTKHALTRRSVLATGAAAATGLTVFSSSTWAQTKKIKVTLPWLPDSNYSYVFVSKAQGYWAKRG